MEIYTECLKNEMLGIMWIELNKMFSQTSLVQISHSFQPMNSTQRKLVHELAEHYNCKTTSYDPEPRRNTVITATRWVQGRSEWILCFNNWLTFNMLACERPQEALFHAEAGHGNTHYITTYGSTWSSCIFNALICEGVSLFLTC